MHCFDFEKRMSRHALCELSGFRSFTSLRLISETTLLHQLCTQTSLITNLTLRLLEQSYTYDRIPDRIFFFDFSHRRVGKLSFINWLKLISESIAFPWMFLSKHLFKFKMKQLVPKMLFLNLILTLERHMKLISVWTLELIWNFLQWSAELITIIFIWCLLYFIFIAQRAQDDKFYIHTYAQKN